MEGGKGMGKDSWLQAAEGKNRGSTSDSMKHGNKNRCIDNTGNQEIDRLENNLTNRWIAHTELQL
jgi:hypothetical protein